MPARRLLAVIWTIGAFAVTLVSWTFYVGPFRWIAEWQLEHFGEYEVKLTLFGTLIVLLIPAGFINGWGPPGAPPPRNPAVRVSNAKRNARRIALLGLAS